VVGEIRTDSGKYNAARWDGNSWIFENIAYPGSWPSYPHNAIFALDSNDIWSATSAAYHWNGNIWEVFGVQNSNWEFNGYVRSIWGTSSNNLYFVGDNGSIVHYDGTSFTRLESGTEVDLEDLDGTLDGEHVFVSGWNLAGDNNTSPLLHLHDGVVDMLYESTYPWGNADDWGRIEALEVIGDTVYLATWGRDWIAYNYRTGEYVEHGKETLPGFNDLQIRDIRSNGRNDLVAVSAFGEVLHFNGADWFRDSQIYSVFGEDFVFKGSAFKGDNLVVVGRLVGWVHGIVARGSRQ
jgi:hypothetical protein